MRHTPGPWEYIAKLSGSENHRGFRVWGPDGWTLADIEPIDQDGKRGEANARLIAAAPELLEALRLFVNCALPVPGAGTHWTEGWLDQALPNARAAIAKAEGQS